jgi:hypothetical protein
MIKIAPAWSTGGADGICQMTVQGAMGDAILDVPIERRLAVMIIITMMPPRPMSGPP